jgi:hypothetical protein
VKHDDQMDKAEHHLGVVGNLDNYKTGNSYTRDEAEEHFHDHFADIHERVGKIRDNQENYENGHYDHDNW